jgi:1,4-dihydroxy-2-naphthoate octaprenyltransferase
MNTLTVWLSAMRLRTLWLAISGAICGAALAFSCDGAHFSWSIALLALLTAVSLQILANLANDLGDFKKGTDSPQRIGPARALQSGAVTLHRMYIAIALAVLASGFFGILLIVSAWSQIGWQFVLLFLVLGVTAVVAAVAYTVGKRAYGYMGLGDLFAFLFFGPVAVAGSYFLQTGNFSAVILFPAAGIGFFTVNVLNVNNMRDIENDAMAGKRTLAVRLGFSKARIYHALVTLAGVICFITYSLVVAAGWLQWLYVVGLLPFLSIAIRLMRIKDKTLLDPYLKYTSISVFVLSILFATGINL